jgi:hypothetical protein
MLRQQCRRSRAPFREGSSTLDLQGPLIGRSVDLYAQSDQIGAPEPMSIEAALADQIGGSARGY